MVSRILVTGASGFIGKSLCAEAVRRGLDVSVVMRKSRCLNAQDATSVVFVETIDQETDWGAALEGVDVVFHLAARVHVMSEKANSPLNEFRKVNVWGTERLARAAAASGVKRLVYVSSIGVNGLFTVAEPFVELGSVAPHSDYAQSKQEAEQALLQVAQETGLEVVIVRPPLVYGIGAPGNFSQMISVLQKRIPLPFAAVRNKRSFIYVLNLVDALMACATHPAAAGKTYLVSDGEDISTPELLRRLGVGIDCPVRLFSCPMIILKLAATIFGKSAHIERLLGSLQIDSSKIRRELNWAPPYSLQQGLQTTGEWYRSNR